MTKVRWGIVGCGDVTEAKSGPGFYKCRGSELVAVMRRDGAKAADYARRHGVRKWYDDADALINDPEVDAVYVATPPGTHEFYAMKVLAARKPCYVEKPMSRNAAEARRMVEAFKAKGVPLFVAYYRRALPRFLKAKEMMDSGLLGKIRTASWSFSDAKGTKREEPVAWRFRPEESGAGLFLDMGSHALDLLDWWFGALKVGTAEALNYSRAYDVEDAVRFTFCAKSGVQGAVVFGGLDGPRDEFTIGGEKGELKLSCFGREEVRVKYYGGPHNEARHEAFDLPHPEHVGMPMIQMVVDELLEAGTCPSTGESGLRTQEVMDAALEKYYGGREDGFWLREWPGNGK